MGYYIETGEELPAAISRIATEQRDKARAALRKKDDRGQSVHTARKHFKKLRGLVRLARDELGEQNYKKQNVYYRDMGRTLAGLRDADTLLEALQLLKDTYQDQLKTPVFDEINEMLREERDQIREEVAEKNSPQKTVLEELEKSDAFIDKLILAPESWGPLLVSLKRVYKRGLKGYRKSLEEPSTEDLHEWRKRAKYLWYHFRLLQKAWPPVFEGMIKETHELSNLLGDHRDLTLLKNKIEQLDNLNPKSVLVIEAVSARHRQTLFEQAQVLGRKIYAETPKAFCKRMSQYPPPAISPKSSPILIMSTW
jgi:CHAD domain-containing protein